MRCDSTARSAQYNVVPFAIGSFRVDEIEVVEHAGSFDGYNRQERRQAVTS
jgi:hypothetical protein